MKTYTLDEAKDMHIGEIGSLERDAYEREVEKAKRKFINQKDTRKESL